MLITAEVSGPLSCRAEPAVCLPVRYRRVLLPRPAWVRCAGSREGGDHERSRGHCRTVSPPRLHGAVVYVSIGEGVRLRARPLQSPVPEGQVSPAGALWGSEVLISSLLVIFLLHRFLPKVYLPALRWGAHAQFSPPLSLIWPLPAVFPALLLHHVLPVPQGVVP